MDLAIYSHMKNFIISLLLIGAVQAAAKPNIVYINIDDLGWADIGINGSTFYETPNIDKLAREEIYRARYL